MLKKPYNSTHFDLLATTSLLLALVLLPMLMKATSDRRLKAAAACVAIYSGRVPVTFKDELSLKIKNTYSSVVHSHTVLCNYALVEDLDN